MSKTTIELDEKDTALVMDENGECRVHIPHMEEDEVVPDNVFFMTAVLLLVNTDEEFNDYVLEKFTAKLDEIKDENPFEFRE